MSIADIKNKVQEKAEQVQVQQQNPVQVTPQKKMEKLINSMLPEIKKAVGNAMTPERMARISLSVHNSNKAFWKCDPMTFLSSMMKSAQCGLEPNTVLGEAYIIPYGDKAEFQIGYKGILTLCHRTGEFKSIFAREVYQNDKFEFEYGLEPKLIHVPSAVPEGEPVYYYAVYKLKNGGEDFVVWSKDRIKAHGKKHSKSFNRAGSPWVEHFDSMAKKTCIIDVLKYAPKSVELAKAMTNDFSEEVKVTDPDGIEVVDLAIDTEYEVIGEKENPEN